MLVCVHSLKDIFIMAENKSSTTLSIEIKKSLAIVLIGNFLEFFDLMLAVHLTLVLTKVFLPVESAISPLLTAFAFCSSFCIRPIAALFWGYIGDTIGRVPVLISTTFIMSISCILIPNIPSYAKWGGVSTALFLILRLVQGFASGGECIAANVFITETVPRPKVFFYNALVEATCSLGGLVACGVGAICLTLSPEDGWKIPFYIGSGIAVLGTIARKTLKETPEFIKTLEHNAKRKKAIDLYKSLNYKNKNIPALFAMYLFPAVAFYFSLAYIPSVLVDKLGMEVNRVMAQTTLVLFIIMCSEVFYGILGLKIHPFKIVKVKLVSLMCIMPIAALYFSNFQSSSLSLFFLQVVVLCLGQGLTPADPIINKSFPIIGRYTSLLLIWAFSHSLVYLLTAYVCENISSFQILCLLLFATALVSLIGLYNFNPHTNDHENDDIFDEKQKVGLIKKWAKEHNYL